MLDWVYTVTRDGWNSFVTYMGAAIGFLLSVFFEVILWLLDMFGPIARRFFMAMASAVGDILSTWPVPQFITDVHHYWQAVPWSTMSYFLSAFEAQYGFTIMTGAAVLRWLLRILPIVGRMFRG